MESPGTRGDEPQIVVQIVPTKRDRVISVERKARRRRAVIGAAVIAALGLGGLGSWQVIERHHQRNDSPTHSQRELPRRSLAEWPATQCDDPAGVQVMFDQPVIEPVIEYVLITSVSERLTQTSNRTGGNLVLDAVPSGSAVLGSEVRQEIIRAGSRNSQLPGFAVAMWGGGSGHPAGLQLMQWDQNRGRAGDLQTWTIRPADRVAVTGVAMCGAETIEFSLAYTHYTSFIHHWVWCPSSLEHEYYDTGDDLQSAARLAWCDLVSPNLERRRDELRDLIDQLHRLEADARYGTEPWRMTILLEVEYIDGSYTWWDGTSYWWMSEFGFMSGPAPFSENPFSEHARPSAGEVFDPHESHVRPGVTIELTE